MVGVVIHHVILYTDIEMDRLLSISRDLSQKVDTNETAANELLQQCEVLQQKIKAMIEYQSAVQEISGGEDHPRGPPRIEFSYIRQLQQDNSELRTLLEEYEAALEMIMGKYRDQMRSFIATKKLEDSVVQENLSEEVRSRTDQLYHMATVMYTAAKAEDVTSEKLEERLSQMEYENRYLRQILSLSSSSSSSLLREDKTEFSHSVNIIEDPGEITTTETVKDTPPHSDSEDSRSNTPKNIDDR